MDSQKEFEEADRLELGNFNGLKKERAQFRKEACEFLKKITPEKMHAELNISRERWVKHNAKYQVF